jgi:hypothetical protein
MPRWNQPQLVQFETEPGRMRSQHLILPIVSQGTDELHTLSLSIHKRGSAASNFTLTESEVKRLYCFVLILQLAEGGLSETIERLIEIDAFYRAGLPANKQTIDTKPVAAQIGSMTVRPVTPVFEDE